MAALGFDIFARDRASKQFDKVGDSIDRTRQRSEKLKNAMKLAGVFIAGAALKIGKDSVTAASDLNEVLSKSEQIFGKQIMPMLVKFANTSATTIGQSKKDALDAAATFGVFGKSAGLAGRDLGKFSIDMTKLASDMASFNNTSPEEAVLAIGAALRGESEPIRRYGVLLNDATLKQQAMKLGLIKTTKEALTPQQKVLAAHAEILKQTKDQQGDFARTSDGLANQQRILSAQWEDAQATLGKKLLPMAVKVVSFVNNDFIPGVKDLSKWIRDNQGTVKALAAAGAILFGTFKLGGLVMKVQAAGGLLAYLKATKLVTGATKIWTGAQWLLNAALHANPVGLVIAALFALGAVLVIAWKKSEKFREILTKALRIVLQGAVALGKFWLTMVQGIIKGWAWVVDKVLAGASKILGGLAKLDDMVGGKIPGDFKKAQEGVDKFRAGVQQNTDKVVRKIDDMKRAMDRVPKKIKTEQEYRDEKARDRLAKFREYANEQMSKISDERVNVVLDTKAQRIFQAVFREKGGWQGGGITRATGGPVFGPGTKTSDSIPARLSRGEHVWTADEVEAAGGHGAILALRRMAKRGELSKFGDAAAFANGGAVLSASLSENGLAGAQARIAARASWIADQLTDTMSAVVNRELRKTPVGRGGGKGGDLSPGQIARGIAFATSQAGKPYLWGGVGPYGYDCSGIQSAALNAALGLYPYSRRGSTGTMPWPGFSRGMGAYTIGWFTGSPGHMAGNMGGYGIESAGGVGVRLGSAARGVRSFPYQAHYDQGGMLMPGWTLAYNGTGRPERVSAGGADRVEVRVYLDGQQMHDALLKVKRRNSGAPLGLD